MHRHNLLVHVTRRQTQLHNLLGETKGTTRYLIGCWFTSRGFSCTLSIFVLSNFWINISWLSGCWSVNFKEKVRFFCLWILICYLEAIRTDSPGRRFAGSYTKIQFAFSMRSSVDEILTVQCWCFIHCSKYYGPWYLSCVLFIFALSKLHWHELQPTTK